MSIKARKLKSGKTVFDVCVFMGYNPDGTRNRRYVTMPTKRAAQLEEARLLAEKDALRGRGGRITLAAYIDNNYWPDALKRLAATSLDTYEKEIRLRIKPQLGNLDVRDIDRPKVQRMVDNCQTSTVAKKCIGVLKTILNEAKADGLIMSNPAEARFTMPSGGQKRDNGVVLTTFDQIRDLLSIVRQNGSQSVQRIAYTGLLEGLRPEERYALDWKDVDLSTQSLNVDKARVIASARHGGVQNKETKTDRSTRVVPMHPWFAEWLSTVPQGSGAFIKGADGRRISPSTAQKRWTRFLDGNPGASRVTIENMRHSFATSYLHAGGNVADLSLLLGHADINTTLRRYVRPSVDDLRRGMMSLNTTDSVMG
jgi:integrase